MSSLVAKSDDGRDVSIPITGPIVIGRSDKDYTVSVRSGIDSISLGISDATVSRSHACVYLESGKLMVKDVGSKNGTIVNGVPLPGWKPGQESRPVEIKGDTTLKLGHNTQVRLTVEDSTERTQRIRL
jgi:pSer/pThr/pTyr-binding forkhead associated (FHA) protein